MRVLANRRIKALLLRIFLCVSGFWLFSALFAGWAALRVREAEPVVTAAVMGMAACAFLTGVLVLAFCCRYFRQQDRIMEEAVASILAFISGDRSARIACDEEGELYRLFHEVNSLAAVLNAKADKEERAREFLKNTISDISHQLKTPLAALNIYNGILQTEAENMESATVREFTALSEQELDRIETLVQNLLKITRFDAGAMVIEKNAENIADMMAEVKGYFSFRADGEGKEIVISGDDSLSLLCDRGWIEEAVGNLLKNALDHMQAGDSVRIEWKQSASAVCIAVKDNGSGIHPEDLHHVFKRFYRSRFSKDKQGIGLGLPLAKAVVEAHGGTIEVDSRLGVGTVFRMYFLICRPADITKL